MAPLTPHFCVLPLTHRDLFTNERRFLVSLRLNLQYYPESNTFMKFHFYSVGFAAAVTPDCVLNSLALLRLM